VRIQLAPTEGPRGIALEHRSMMVGLATRKKEESIEHSRVACGIVV